MSINIRVLRLHSTDWKSSLKQAYVNGHHSKPLKGQCHRLHMSTLFAAFPCRLKKCIFRGDTELYCVIFDL